MSGRLIFKFATKKAGCKGSDSYNGDVIWDESDGPTHLKFWSGKEYVRLSDMVRNEVDKYMQESINMKPESTKTKNRLTWKKKYLSDGSGSWYAAKVKILDWEYVVDSVAEGFYAGVFYSSQDPDIIKLSKSPRRTVEKAQADCEKHLQRMFDKFKTWMKTQ